MDADSLYSVDINENKNDSDIQSIGAFRRVLPQLLGSLAKNLMILNIGEFAGFSAIVISSLTGLSKELNPDETVQITPAQASWLSSFALVAHPIGSLFSGPINDKIGRRRAIMLVNIPLTIGWIVLGFSHSFSIICVLFTLLGFSFGLKEAPSFTYISEICEPSVRGVMMTISSISFSVGMCLVSSFGSILCWRHVSFICAIVPICCFTAVCFVPESPSWLLSKGREQEALRSLQWLRGWVSPQTVHAEFTELRHYSQTSNACASCSKRKIKCNHPKPTFYEKIKELKRRRNLLPFILIVCLQFLTEFNGFDVWRSYIIQVLVALGTPIQSNKATVLVSISGIFGCICQMLTIKKLGRRRIYLTSIMVLAICCFWLSAYGFTFLPLGWTSFKRDPNEPPRDPKLIGGNTDNYNYLALFMVALMAFCTRMAVDAMPVMYASEIFPFRSRSFLCGIALANHYILSAIASKTYYNIEMWLSLPGAISFYGIISLIGFFVIFLIMPETEQRSLQDIELHYSDKSTRITDIYIRKSSEIVK